MMLSDWDDDFPNRLHISTQTQMMLISSEAKEIEDYLHSKNDDKLIELIGHNNPNYLKIIKYCKGIFSDRVKAAIDLAEIIEK